MKENTLRKLKSLLLNRRREMLKQVAHLEAEQEELEQRFIEKIDVAQKEDLAWLIDKLDDLKARFHKKDIHAATRLAFGSVVKAILNVAAETGTDLIAMATHGLSGLARVSYGSVAAGVLQAADIPILLIRSGDDKK